MLARSDRGPLRAHLRACPECARRARRVRAQRRALKSLALLPLPGSLDWVTQSAPVAAVSASIAESAPVMGSLAAKLAAGALAASALIGASYEGFTHAPRPAPPARHTHHLHHPAARITHTQPAKHSASTLRLTGNLLRAPSARSRTVPRRPHSPVAAERSHHRPPKSGTAHTTTVKPSRLRPTAPQAHKLRKAKPPEPARAPSKRRAQRSSIPPRDQPRDQRGIPKPGLREKPPTGRHPTR
jgi:hypothetical protein